MLVYITLFAQEHININIYNVVLTLTFIFAKKNKKKRSKRNTINHFPWRKMYIFSKDRSNCTENHMQTMCM